MAKQRKFLNPACPNSFFDDMEAEMNNTKRKKVKKSAQIPPEKLFLQFDPNKKIVCNSEKKFDSKPLEMTKVQWKPPILHQPENIESRKNMNFGNVAVGREDYSSKYNVALTRDISTNNLNLEMVEDLQGNELNSRESAEGNVEMSVISIHSSQEQNSPDDIPSDTNHIQHEHEHSKEVAGENIFLDQRATIEQFQNIEDPGTRSELGKMDEGCSQNIVSEFVGNYRRNHEGVSEKTTTLFQDFKKIKELSSKDNCCKKSNVLDEDKFHNEERGKLCNDIDQKAENSNLNEIQFNNTLLEANVDPQISKLSPSSTCETNIDQCSEVQIITEKPDHKVDTLCTLEQLKSEKVPHKPELSPNKDDKIYKIQTESVFTHSCEETGASQECEVIKLPCEDINVNLNVSSNKDVPENDDITVNENDSMTLLLKNQYISVDNTIDNNVLVDQKFEQKDSLPGNTRCKMIENSENMGGGEINLYKENDYMGNNDSLAVDKHLTNIEDIPEEKNTNEEFEQVLDKEKTIPEDKKEIDEEFSCSTVSNSQLAEINEKYNKSPECRKAVPTVVENNCEFSNLIKLNENQEKAQQFCAIRHRRRHSNQKEIKVTPGNINCDSFQTDSSLMYRYSLTQNSSATLPNIPLDISRVQCPKHVSEMETTTRSLSEELNNLKRAKQRKPFQSGSDSSFDDVEAEMNNTKNKKFKRSDPMQPEKKLFLQSGRNLKERICNSKPLDMPTVQWKPPVLGQPEIIESLKNITQRNNGGGEEDNSSRKKVNATEHISTDSNGLEMIEERLQESELNTGKYVEEDVEMCEVISINSSQEENSPDSGPGDSPEHERLKEAVEDETVLYKDAAAIQIHSAKDTYLEESCEDGKMVEESLHKIDSGLVGFSTTNHQDISEKTSTHCDDLDSILYKGEFIKSTSKEITELSCKNKCWSTSDVLDEDKLYNIERLSYDIHQTDENNELNAIQLNDNALDPNVDIQISQLSPSKTCETNIDQCNGVEIMNEIPMDIINTRCTLEKLNNKAAKDPQDMNKDDKTCVVHTESVFEHSFEETGSSPERDVVKEPNVKNEINVNGSIGTDIPVNDGINADNSTAPLIENQYILFDNTIDNNVFVGQMYGQNVPFPTNEDSKIAENNENMEEGEIMVNNENDHTTGEYTEINKTSVVTNSLIDVEDRHEDKNTNGEFEQILEEEHNFSEDKIEIDDEYSCLLISNSQLEEIEKKYYASSECNKAAGISIAADDNYVHSNLSTRNENQSDNKSSVTRCVGTQTDSGPQNASGATLPNIPLQRVQFPNQVLEIKSKIRSLTEEVDNLNSMLLRFRREMWPQRH